MRRGIAETSVWGGWALDRKTAIEVDAFYRRYQPRIVLEVGSGYSTVIAGEYARDTGATVTTLEHDPQWARLTQGILEARGVADHVNLLCSPLRPVTLPNGRKSCWFTNVELPNNIDACLIDDPPENFGRHATLYAIKPHLNPDGWRVLLDDSDRVGERKALIEWKQLLRLDYRVADLPRGLAIITGSAPPPVDASDVVLTILTGRRPGKLAVTLESLRAHAAGLLETAHVIMIHNGGDRTTRDMIDTIPAIDDIITLRQEMRPMGEALSTIIGRLPKTNRAYWLHLEDDWKIGTTIPAHEWLSDATKILDTTPDIGQVRLQHISEPNKEWHLETGEHIRWEEQTNHMIGDAHYTCNPALMRTKDAELVWPAAGKLEAIARYRMSGLLVAQLQPGVFHHHGDDNQPRYRLPIPSRLLLAPGPRKP